LREADTPFFVNVEPRPWLTSGGARRAGVSSFGFGGTNFHAVLEEYSGDGRGSLDSHMTADWPAEIFLWQAQDLSALDTLLGQALSKLPSKARLSHLAAAINKPALQNKAAGVRLAMVARSLDELRERLTAARAYVARGEKRVSSPREGIYLGSA